MGRLQPYPEESNQPIKTSQRRTVSRSKETLENGVSNDNHELIRVHNSGRSAESVYSVFAMCVPLPELPGTTNHSRSSVISVPWASTPPT